MTESVLVFPRALLDRLGAFQGLSDDIGRYLPALLDPAVCFFMPRESAEADPTHKQVIPYVVLRHRNRVFHYVRGARSGEARLRGQSSIGIGGHVNPADRGLFSQESFYDEAVRRELAEEVRVDAARRERVAALINDDSTPVGSVHFGIVHVFDLDAPVVTPRESKITQPGFSTVDRLLGRRDDFEGWSVLCLEALAAGRF